VEHEGVLQWSNPCSGCSLHVSQMNTIDNLTYNFINFSIYVELLKKAKYVIRMAGDSVEFRTKQEAFFLVSLGGVRLSPFGMSATV
jgi:hypothetical protein